MDNNFKNNKEIELFNFCKRNKDAFIRSRVFRDPSNQSILSTHLGRLVNFVKATEDKCFYYDKVNQKLMVSDNTQFGFDISYLQSAAYELTKGTSLSFDEVMEALSFKESKQIHTSFSSFIKGRPFSRYVSLLDNGEGVWVKAEYSDDEIEVRNEIWKKAIRWQVCNTQLKEVTTFDLEGLKSNSLKLPIHPDSDKVENGRDGHKIIGMEQVGNNLFRKDGYLYALDIDGSSWVCLLQISDVS